MKFFSKKNFLVSFIIFIFCFLLGIFLLYIERFFLGISSTYHPDSAWYLNNFKTHSYLSVNLSLAENIINFFKYFPKGHFYLSIVSLFHEIKHYNIFKISNAYRNLILLNIFIYSVTSALIFYHYFQNFHNKERNNLFISSIFVFILLPYKLHLSVHILKESFIFLFLIISILYNSKISFLFSFIFGSSFRFGYIFYYLIFFDLKNFFKLKKIMYLIITLSMIFMIFYFKIGGVKDDNINLFQNFITFLDDRHTNVMDGRNFDTIPNFTNQEFGYIYRAILWPLLFLSGTFIFLTDNIFFKLLGIEIIILQFISWFCHKKIIINLGIVLFLFILSLWVTTFTSFYRYSYLAFLALFIKMIFEKKYNNKL